MTIPASTVRFKAVKVLPPEVEALIRKTSVPPHLRTLFTNLPGPIHVDVTVHPQHIPPTLKQLMKLSASGGSVRLKSVTTVPDPALCSLMATRGKRSHRLSIQALQGDVGAAIHEILLGVFLPGEMPELLEEQAFQTSTLATLQSVTRHMLAAHDVDRAIGVMLGGITAGYSLGFNRAALLVLEASTGMYVGTHGVGPDTAAEAHATWARMEEDDASVDALMLGLDGAANAGPFGQRVKQVRFQLDYSEQDPFMEAVASDKPLVAVGEGHPVLDDAMGMRGDVVLAMMRTRRQAAALVVADNAFTGTPATPARLRLLQLFMDQAALVWENLLLRAELEQLARVDALTGVLSRRELDARLEDEIARARRHSHPCGVLVVDVDHFKAVNDSSGHAAGDGILRTLGQVLRKALRSTDVVGRFGGDEFVVFLQDIHPPELALAVERLGRAARAEGIPLSMGGAHFPSDCRDPSQLMALADAQLYRAKHLGRGRGCIGGQVEPVAY